ncbi:MAG: hypothetical protein H0T12_08595, partial [Actinobacteria bacterium]|nr:hypothetical protein [Actinomycetota bacterium]
MVRRLVTKDHTFGASRSPFGHVYIVNGVVKGAGDPMEGNREPGTPFTEEIKEGLRKELDGIPPVSFVTDLESVRLGLDGMRGIKNDGVIITLGPLTGDAATVEVSNSLWCGGECGQWLTYIVKLRGGHWSVTGTTG